MQKVARTSSLLTFLILIAFRLAILPRQLGRRSSLSSPQSLFLSQTLFLLMHLPFRHRNSYCRQERFGANVFPEKEPLFIEYHANDPLDAWRPRKWLTLDIFTSYFKTWFALTRVYCYSFCKTTVFVLVDKVTDYICLNFAGFSCQAVVMKVCSWDTTKCEHKM